MPSYVDKYKARSWELLEFPANDEINIFLETTRGWECCASDSPMAKRLGDNARRFYWDKELKASGLDPRTGGRLCELVSEWNGHTKGTLVMVIYTGAQNVPPTFTYAVEQRTA